MSDATVPELDRVTDAFFAVDDDWRFTYANRTAAGLFERSRDDLIGRVLWDAFPESLVLQSPEGFYRAKRNQRPLTTELYHERLETPFEARAFPSESGLSVYVADVSRCKRREAERARYAAALEALEVGVVTLDDSYRVVSINDALAETFSVEEGDLVGAHVEAVIETASIAGEDAVAIGRAIDEVGAGNAQRRTAEVTYEVAGERRYGEVRIVPVDADDAAIAAVLRDVTEQRDYEHLVHSLHEITRWLLESSDPEEICAIAVHAGSDLLELPISGIWLLDDEQGYLDPIAGTAGAHEEFGGLPRFRPGEGLVWDVYEAGEPELFDDLLEERANLYNPDTPLRSEIIAPIGTHGILMTGSFEPNRFSETDLELIATLTENTRAALDRAERERMLRERTDRLERQSERLEAVATVLSEDLKGELSAVADALEDDRSTPEEWEFPFAKNRVSETLDRTERLIDDIREYARNATSVGQRAPIDLETAIEDAIGASRLEQAAVVVEDGATLRADPDRFRYLLETVFDDAAARSVGDVTVQVGTLGLETHAEGSRGFFILDDASKNPPSATDTIPDLSLDADEAGEGLGLAVARAIAEAHDWSVSIGVGENGGTRFEVRDVTTLESA